MKINIIVGSIRRSRGSDKVANWVKTTADEAGLGAEFAIVDLKDYDLPLFAESQLPMAQQNRQETGAVKEWLDAMSDADGFIFVTPEYNHSIPSALKNAIDYLDFQLMKKPIAIASHGAMGGARANEQLRLIINSNLGGLPISNSVTLKAPVAFEEVVKDDGHLVEQYVREQKPLDSLLENIVWYTEALKTAREK